MLALSRRVGQSILIGDDIIVHVVSIDRNQVRLSFEAPKDVRILRTELEKDFRDQGKVSV
jgi:carbon storage regulator